MKILTGVIPVIVHEGKVLMLKRVKPPYVGYWALLGGKIDFGEHPEESAVREIKEEAGIETEVLGFKGILSEHIKDKETKENIRHFILFVLEMKALTTNIKNSAEGELKWFEMDKLENYEGIIPSDVPIIRKILQNENYIDIHKSIMIKDGDKYHCEEFRK